MKKIQCGRWTDTSTGSKPGELARCEEEVTHVVWNSFSGNFNGYCREHAVFYHDRPGFLVFRLEEDER